MFKGLLNNLWVLRWEEEEEGGGWGARVEKEESKLTAVEEHGLPGCFVDKELGRGVDFQAGSMGGGEEEGGEYGQGAHHKGCLQHHPCHGVKDNCQYLEFRVFQLFQLQVCESV